MGYMGFGMQKWIYKQRPRRPFSKERKSYCSTLPDHEYQNAYTDNNIKLSGRISDNELSEEELHEQKVLKRSKLFIRGTFITLAIGLFFGLISHFSLKEDNYFAKERTRHEIIQKRQAFEHDEAYKLLIKSGKIAMENRRYDSAIKEFDQALKISHDHLESRELLVDALIHSCSEEGKNCDRAINESKFLYEITQSSRHKENLRLLYLHLGLFQEVEDLNQTD